MRSFAPSSNVLSTKDHLSDLRGDLDARKALVVEQLEGPGTQHVAIGQLNTAVVEHLKNLIGFGSAVRGHVDDDAIFGQNLFDENLDEARIVARHITFEKLVSDKFAEQPPGGEQPVVGCTSRGGFILFLDQPLKKQAVRLRHQELREFDIFEFDAGAVDAIELGQGNEGVLEKDICLCIFLRQLGLLLEFADHRRRGGVRSARYRECARLAQLTYLGKVGLP